MVHGFGSLKNFEFSRMDPSSAVATLCLVHPSHLDEFEFSQMPSMYWPQSAIIVLVRGVMEDGPKEDPPIS